MKRMASAALVAVCLAAPCAMRAQHPGSSNDSALFEVRIGRLSPFLITAIVDTTGTVMIPLDPILAAAGVPRRRDELETTVTGPRLAALLNSRVDINTADLVISIQRGTPFPAEREAERLTMDVRDPRLGRSGVGAPSRWVPRTGGALVEWRAVAAPSTSGTSLFAESRLGLAVAGGDLTFDGYTERANDGGNRSWGDWSYGFVDPTTPYFRELRVGDLLGGNIIGRSLRGVSITNRQPFRSGYFGEVAFVPIVPAGWSYDVYRDGRLIDFADGALASRPTVVPAQYGATPIELREYGPSGELRVVPLMLMVPSTQLPRGRIEYDVVAGRCSTTDCRRLGYITADAGLSDVLTLGLGVEELTDSLRSRLSPVARVSYARFNGWQLQADYQPAVLERARLSYSGSARFAGSVEGGRSYEIVDGLRSVSTTRDRWFADGNSSVRLSNTGAGWLPSAVLVNGSLAGDSGSIHGWSAGLEAILHGSSIGVFHASDALFSQHSTTLRTTILRPWRRGALKNVPVVSAGVGVEGRGAQFVEAGATVELRRSGTVSFAARAATSPYRHTVATISYSALLDPVRVGIQAQSLGRGRSATTVDLGGALMVDPRQGALVDATASTRSAGVRGFVYYDENADGVFDDGDRLGNGLRVIVSGHQATTDERGRFQLWNVVPYEPLDVRVDSIAGIDPAFSQVPDDAPVRATPNVFNPVDVRLVRVCELSGRVELDGAAGPGGVRIVLEEVTSRRRYETVTFADGRYSFDRVFPGRYELRVAASVLAALNARADGTAVQVPASSGPTVRITTHR